MGLLDGQIAAAIHKGFKGKLLSGVLRQVITPDSGGLDDLGDPVDGVATDTPCEGFTENYSAYHRAQAGIPQTDLKVNIFAQSMPGVIPSKDAAVKFMRAGVAEWYQLRGPREIDPAGALWVCQAYMIEQEPAG